MKRIYTFFLFLSISWGAVAQHKPAREPKTKQVKQAQADHTLKYSVLQQDPTMKHGPTVMKGKNWRSEGLYAMGERVGIWSFYGAGNKLEHQFDFTTSKVVADKVNMTQVNEMVYQDGAYTKTKVDSRAFFFGGEGRMMSLLGKNMRYPAEAQRVGKQGLSVIGVEIDETGKVTDMAVAKEAGYVLDQEALRVVGLIPNEWVPAMLDGKPVKSLYYIPVRFSTR